MVKPAISNFLFIFSIASSSMLRTTFVITSEIVSFLVNLILFSLNILDRPLVPSSPNTILRTRLAGIRSADIKEPEATLVIQSSDFCMNTSSASLVAPLLKIGAASSIIRFVIFDSLSSTSSAKLEAPRNLPKPSCAAPATPPSKEEKPVCNKLYFSCDPAVSKVFCAMTSFITAKVASNPVVAYKDLVALVSNSSFCLAFAAFFAKALRFSFATR